MFRSAIFVAVAALAVIGELVQAQSGSGSDIDAPITYPIAAPPADGPGSQASIAADLASAGHSVVDVVEVDGVIAGLTCEQADTAERRAALSSVVTSKFVILGGDPDTIVAAITTVCPNKYVAQRNRRNTASADFSTELVTAGASQTSTATAAASFDYSGVIPGVDTSSVGATVSTRSESVAVSRLSDTSGVTSFSNLLINGQEIFDAMSIGAKPSQYGSSWGAICSDLGTESAGCPSWGKFAWCQPGFDFYDSAKSSSDCSSSGLMVEDGRCYTCV